MAYVYRHIRIDKNEPFYIGIGSDETYNRAYSVKRRNILWNSVVSRSQYEVEILMDNLTWEQACEKEKEFISIYGRKDLKTGILTNMTSGGEGVIDRLVTEEFREKCMISKLGESNPRYGKKPWNFGKKLDKWNHTQEVIEKMKKPKNKTNCPHCNLYGAVNQLKRWHFDNCKFKTN